MKCPRCTGLMIRDEFLDLQDEAGRCRFMAWRCMICGEVIDPVILQHRTTRPAPMLDRARPQLHGPVSIRTTNRGSWDDPDEAVSLLVSTEVAESVSRATS